MSFSREQVLSEFIDAWKAGERPRVDDYLRRVPAESRDELAADLEQWLLVAPAPAYSEATLAEIRAEPAFARAMAEIEAEQEPLAVLLPRLRERAGLGLRDLAQRVTSAFGLSGEEARAEGYLERMERGELDPSRVSRRLLGVLASALGVSAETLWRPAPAGQALWRAETEGAAAFQQELEVLAEAALSPAPQPMDELDRLFVGGPEA